MTHVPLATVGILLEQLLIISQNFLLERAHGKKTYPVLSFSWTTGLSNSRWLLGNFRSVALPLSHRHRTLGCHKHRTLGCPLLHVFHFCRCVQVQAVETKPGVRSCLPVQFEDFHLCPWAWLAFLFSFFFSLMLC